MRSVKKGNKFMFFLIIYFLLLSTGLINIISINFVKGNLPIYIFLSQGIQFLIPFLIYTIITKNNIYKTLPLKKLSFKNIILIILMSLVVQPAMMFLSGISSIFFKNDISNVIQYITNFPLYLGIFAIALTPAIFEEITFRGIILYEYKNINIKKAAIVNGIFFGIMHLDLQQFFYVTILGILLTYLVYYTDSIFASMIAHFTINSSQFILAYITTNFSSKTLIDNTENNINILTSLLITSIISSLFIPIFIYLAKKFIKYNSNILENKKNSQFTDPIKINDFYFKLIIILYIIYSIYILYKNKI